MTSHMRKLINCCIVRLDRKSALLLSNVYDFELLSRLSSTQNENLHNEKSSVLELMFLHNFALSTSELPSYYFTASVHVIDISYSRIIDLRSKLRNDK